MLTLNNKPLNFSLMGDKVDPYKHVQRGKGLSLKKKQYLYYGLDCIVRGPHSKSSTATKVSKAPNLIPNSTSNPTTAAVVVKKTATEVAFESAQSEKRKAELKKKLAGKSHKEKVAEFNEKLAKLSDHYDIPKVKHKMSKNTFLCLGRSRLIIAPLNFQLLQHCQ